MNNSLPGRDKGCPENSKAGLEEMEAAVATLQEISDKMKVMDLQATIEASNAIPQQQEHCKEIMNVDNMGSMKNQYGHLIVE
jgi:hypothetical protein